MNGVISLLDDKHYKLTEHIWGDLAAHLGLRGIYVTPFPHFTYKVAAKFDLEVLEPVLAEIAQKQPPFTVRTSGIGIFPGEKPIVYIPVVRDSYLTRFQERLWQMLENIGEEVDQYYHPESWIPHVSVAFGDVTADNLPDVVTYLNELDLYWEITVDNLAVIYNNGTGQTVTSHHRFKG
jgi:2'-5' RNA ligase